MKTILKVAAISSSLALMLCGDFSSQGLLSIGLFADARAWIVAREARMTAVATTAAVESSAAAAAAQQQAAAAQQQAAAAQQQAAAAKQQAAAVQQQPATVAQQQTVVQPQQTVVAPQPLPGGAAPAPSTAPLPLGVVVPTLPPGCISTPVGGVEYFYCGGNFYRAAFQGNNLVYVTTKP